MTTAMAVTDDELRAAARTLTRWLTAAQVALPVGLVTMPVLLAGGSLARALLAGAVVGVAGNALGAAAARWSLTSTTDDELAVEMMNALATRRASRRANAERHAVRRRREPRTCAAAVRRRTALRVTCLPRRSVRRTGRRAPRAPTDLNLAAWPTSQVVTDRPDGKANLDGKH